MERSLVLSLGGGMMRGGGGGVNMRGRGGPRGSFMRGGRGGGMARGGGGGTGGGVNTEALYEDVYEPAPQAFNNTGGYENGSTAATTGNSYFEEFPEPGGGGGDAMNFPRQSQGKQSRLNSIGTGSRAVGSFAGINQKAY